MPAHSHRIQKKEAPLFSTSALCFGFFSLFCLFLILRNSDIAILYMTRGLILCAKTVIPSLFPFMVISELILSLGIGELLCRPFAPLCRFLFRISKTGACAVLLGMLCGFPIGAKCAMTALENGKIDRLEAERILNFSNNPSSAFLISAVGVSLWGNRRFGITLYIIALLSQILTGILFARLKKESLSHIPSEAKAPHTPRPFGIGIFTDAVRNSCFSMLLVCAYVVFFSALVGTLGILLDRFSLPPVFSAAVFCLFELSGGVSNAAALPSPTVAALLTAFAIGWSGLSVHCQILSICDGHGIRFRSYFLSKILQGVLCVLLLWGAITAFPTLLLPAQEAVGITLTPLFPLPLITLLFLLALPSCFYKKPARSS